MNLPKSQLTALLISAAWLITACGTAQPTASTPDPIISGDVEFPVQMQLLGPHGLMDTNIISEFDEKMNVSILPKDYVNDKALMETVANLDDQPTLLIVSNYAASSLIEQGLIASLDPANIPNLSNLDPRFRNLSYDLGNQYCVPFAWGLLGIGYVNGQGFAPSSWGDLFRISPEAPTYGHVTLLNHVRETLGAALIHLGYSANSMNEAEILEAKQLILDSAESFDSLDSLSYGEDLATFQIQLAQGWNRDFYLMLETNQDVNFVVPQEGALTRIYSLCIPAKSGPGTKAASEAFINLVLENEWAASFVFNVEVASTISTANDLIALDQRENPLIYPSDEAWENAETIRSLGVFEIVYENAWEDIQAAIP